MTLTFDKDLAEAIWNYHISMGLDDKVQETIKTLCRQALAADPVAGNMHGAAMRAWNDVRRWSMQQLSEKLNEIFEELQTSLRSMDAAKGD